MAIARVSLDEGFYNTAHMYVPGASQYICESEDDVAKLPKDDAKVAVGSRAMVIPTGNVYIFGPSKTWIKYKGISIVE